MENLIDYNKLQTFVVIGETGSMSAAAIKLRRSQSAISQQIQILENDLGVRLLERKNARVFLSKDGEALLEVAKSHLRRIQAEVLRIQDKANALEGEILIASVKDYANEFNVGKAVGSFCQEFPKVSVKLRFGNSQKVEELLLENKADIGIAIVFSHPEQLIRKKLNVANHSLFASKKYLNRIGTPKTYRDILDTQIIDLNEKFGALGNWFKKNSPSLVPSLLHRKPDIVAPGMDVTRDIVMSGYGCAILPDYLVATEVKRKTCVKVMPRARSLQAGLDIAYRTNKTLSLVERKFIDFTVKLASRL